MSKRTGRIVEPQRLANAPSDGLLAPPVFGMSYSGANSSHCSSWVREYRMCDLDEMHAIELQCFSPLLCYSRAKLRALAESKRSITVVGNCDGEMAGFCIARVEAGRGYILTLDVAVKLRRRGVGQILMRTIESMVCASGNRAISLHVQAKNFGAIRFYENLGFSRVCYVPAYYRCTDDAWLYTKVLL